MGKEPRRLRRGKAFHKRIQSDWEQNAEGAVASEKTIQKPSGRAGRIDVIVEAGEDLVAVIEIKASDWDRMTVAALRRNVQRQVRQVWDYIRSQLEKGTDVCPGVVFPRRPQDGERLRMIEELFEEEGIPVVWEDESIEERKARG